MGGESLKGASPANPAPRPLPPAVFLPSPHWAAPAPGVPERTGLRRDPGLCSLSSAGFPVALPSLASHRRGVVLAGAVTHRPCVSGVGWGGVDWGGAGWAGGGVGVPGAGSGTAKSKPFREAA